eukprot:scaffold48170_cov62-Phaeocystis_antarctica.AAC.3
MGFANVAAPGRIPRAAPWPRQAAPASPPAVRVTACVPRRAVGRHPGAARPRPWRRRAECSSRRAATTARRGAPSRHTALL